MVSEILKIFTFKSEYYLIQGENILEEKKGRVCYIDILISFPG